MAKLCVKRRRIYASLCVV